MLSSVVDLFVQAILETMLSSIDTETEGGGGVVGEGEWTQVDSRDVSILIL